MFDVQRLRAQFPALHRRFGDRPALFLDGPGGTQVPQRVIDAMMRYLSSYNANQGACFATSRESDAIIDAAHRAMADFLNAPSPDEIIFGQNMTSLTFHLSRSIGRTLKPGDEVIVTRLDHDANVSPWVLAACDAGATVQRVDIDPKYCVLDLDDFERKLSSRTRWVAVGAASNVVGTINPVRRMAKWAHAAGAKVFVDAVHYAPHALTDVQAWDCDLLACSAYKFFGPHVGVLWGRRQLLEELVPYKVRPASDRLPGRWMTGTQNHEGLAGVVAAIDYLASIGGAFPGSPTPVTNLSGRRRELIVAMEEIQRYEFGLAFRLLEALAARPRFKVWGLPADHKLSLRVPTVAITMEDRSASAIAEHLSARNIFVWSGNMYAVELTERLGLEDRGGLLRIGLVHYNTEDEIDRLLGALDEMP